jgi:hypothetical protein
MPKIRNAFTGRSMSVSSKVEVGRPGSARQRSYCARTARIKGNWKTNINSKNLNQRIRWKCPPVSGERRP